VRDEHAHLDAALYGRAECLLDFLAVGPKNGDLDVPPGPFNRSHHRCKASFGLDDEVHS
jgi:hypothetical protein